LHGLFSSQPIARKRNIKRNKERTRISKKIW
jgi:hypothetical protein